MRLTSAVPLPTELEYELGGHDALANGPQDIDPVIVDDPEIIVKDSSK